MKNTITFSDRIKLAKFVLTSNKFTSGPKVKEFEQKWSDWIGSKYSLFVSSGSTANFLLVASMIEKYQLKRGDKVLVPACTWVTNVAPIIQLGLTPVFCDINFDNFSFDETHIRKIASKHYDIKAIFVTHLLGFTSDIPMLKSYFPGSLILEDVCESHGCRDIAGRKCGPNYIGGTFSFYFGHHMTTIEGGMVSTNDPELYDIMRIKRSHGLARESIYYDEYKKKYPDIIPSFLFVSDGYNFRNTDLGAVLGISQLKRLDSMIKTRNENYKTYYDLISEYNDKFYVPENNFGMSSFAFPFISKTKEIHNKLISKFIEYEIEYRPVVSGNLLNQPFLKDFNLERENPNVDILNERGCYIGNNHFVGNNEMELLYYILEEL